MVLLSVFAFVLISPAASDPFADWKAAFGKHYGDATTEQKRRATYNDNARLVEELNSRNDGDVVYSNDGPYADLSPEEFQASVLMPKRQVPPALDQAREQHAPPLKSGLPESIDWTTKGAVAPVRDQGSLGSCWAFSTAENLEGQHAIATGKVVPLSVEQLLECDASSDATCHDQTKEKGGCADCGEFGGWPYLAYQYLQKAGGIFTEAEFPYFDQTFWPCMPKGYSRKMCGNHDDMYCNASSTRGQKPGGLCYAKSGFTASVTGWKSLSTNETELAAQLVQYGPLSVLINAGNIGGLQSYHSGIWRGGWFGCKVDPDSGIMGLDHAVLLVGFGVEGNKKYWKVKNSWGKKWGEQGFFRIERGTGRCGINLAATTAQISKSDEMVV